MVALEWHLRFNHYPPIHDDWIEPARAALAAMEEDDYTREIEVPNHPTQPTGTTTTDAWRIIEGLQLHACLSDDAYDAWINTEMEWMQ